MLYIHKSSAILKGLPNIDGKNLYSRYSEIRNNQNATFENNRE